jgi:hypothetical protein
MKKLYLEDIIEKYHLGGLVERVKISISNKTLTINFISTQKNLLGKLVAPNVELEDCEFGVYNTSQLLKLVGITNNFITLNVEKKGKITNKLLIADSEYNLEYILADTSLTPTIPILDEPEYDMVAPINAEFITRFMKATKALSSEVFIVEQSVDVDNKNAICFTLGGSEDYTNKVNFTLLTSKSSIPGVEIKFPLAEFNEILGANKEFESATLSINEEGLLKAEFTNKEGVNIVYTLVGKE